MTVPTIITDAITRARREDLDSAVSWIWFFSSDAEARASVDSWLVSTQHPLAKEPGTKCDRFRAIVKELSDPIK